MTKTIAEQIAETQRHMRHIRMAERAKYGTVFAAVRLARNSIYLALETECDRLQNEHNRGIVHTVAVNNLAEPVDAQK